MPQTGTHMFLAEWFLVTTLPTCLQGTPGAAGLTRAKSGGLTRQHTVQILDDVQQQAELFKNTHHKHGYVVHAPALQACVSSQQVQDACNLSPAVHKTQQALLEAILQGMISAT